MRIAEHSPDMDQFLGKRRLESKPPLPTGWNRIDGWLTYTLPDMTTVTVFKTYGFWYWSAIAADGQSARYSTAFPNELAAWKSAIDFVKQFPSQKGE